MSTKENTDATITMKDNKEKKSKTADSVSIKRRKSQRTRSKSLKKYSNDATNPVCFDVEQIDDGQTLAENIAMKKKEDRKTHLKRKQTTVVIEKDAAKPVVKEDAAKEKPAVKEKEAAKETAVGKEDAAKEKPVVKEKETAKESAFVKKDAAKEKPAVKEKEAAKETAVGKEDAAKEKPVVKEKETAKESAVVKKDAAKETAVVKKKNVAREKTVVKKKDAGKEKPVEKQDAAKDKKVCEDDTRKRKQLDSQDDFESPVKQLRTSKSTPVKTAMEHKYSRKKKRNNKDEQVCEKGSGKRTEVDSQDDFQSPIKTRKKTPQKEFQQRKFVEFTRNTLHMKCKSSGLLDAISSLSDEQKKAVKEMGFEALLSLKINFVPTMLGYWLVMNYDEDRQEINTGNHRIKITSKLVEECLGIPRGKITVLEKNKPRKGVGERVDEFKNQFDTTKISVIKVIDLIKESSQAGKLFNTNFLVVVNTLLGETTQSTTVNQRFIIGIENDSEIPNMNWCGYMLECLRRSKKKWKGGIDQFTGPIILLAVIFAHSYFKRHKKTSFKVETPAVKYITTELLNNLQKHFYNNGPLTDDEETDDDVEMNENPKSVESDTEDKSKKNVQVSNVEEPIGDNTNEEGRNEPNDDFTTSLPSTRLSDSTFDINKFEIGTSTQKLFNYCATPLQVSGLSSYLGPDYRSNEKQWLITLENHMEKFEELKEVINQMVKEGKSKFPWNQNVQDMCKEWEAKYPLSQSTNDDTNIINLDEPSMEKVDEEGVFNKEAEVEQTMKSHHEERSLNDGGLEGVFNKEAEVEQTIKSRHEERSLNDGGLEGIITQLIKIIYCYLL
ncbi:uncharacterized protein LOC110925257 [Helianthus annuus]|uniref:uncharacterized protein LOC110925257 n=1 Tax=Helianthus annuus TaxID=4232 RepID=UPI000B908063|nr:uncharacterized protein LOC110925257 [Helianthus annuus]